MALSFLPFHTCHRLSSSLLRKIYLDIWLLYDRGSLVEDAEWAGVNGQVSRITSTVVESSSVEESPGVEEDDEGMADTHWKAVIR